VLTIGARDGRFTNDGKVKPMPGHSSVLALSGLMILIIGWVGFNAGSAAPGSDLFSQIALNTVAAMSFGGAAGMAYDMARNKGRLRPRATISSILGGLIAITAGCAYVEYYSAMAIGIIGGLTATIMSDVLLERFKIDDPVDAIACHGFTGLAGTLLVAAFAKPEHLVNGSRLEQLVVQATGSIMAFVWAFGVTAAALYIMKRMGMAVRVTKAEEKIGLNLSEHGEGFDIESLKALMASQNSHAQTGSKRPVRNEADIYDGIGGEEIDESSNYDRNATLGFIGEVVDNANAVAKENQINIERLNDIEKVGSDWLFETDAAMRVSRISEKFFKTFGEKARGVVGRSYFELLSAREVSIEKHKNQIARRETFDDLTFGVIGPDRQTRIFAVSGIAKFDLKGQFEGYRGRAADITEKVKADEEIRFMALHDHLTGLNNRAAFDHLGHAVLERNATVLIGTIDLDGFKNVNDTFGHPTGDALLKMVAARISDKLGPDAVVSRFGGDEFVFAKPANPEFWPAELHALADGLVDELCSPFMIDGMELFIGGSLGVAVYPDHQKNMSELLRCSDMALYEAKQMGRGQWVAFKQELEDRAKRRKRLEND
ncbi:MAG: diguanylate cyclase domain-containing protein, partial [Notoacmeibacter sp.]